jgi:hypothetical protein
LFWVETAGVVSEVSAGQLGGALTLNMVALFACKALTCAPFFELVSYDAKKHHSRT